MARGNGTKVRSSERYRLLGPESPEWAEALTADIAQRGIQKPVETDERGFVLDGHLRLKIARTLGIKCPTVVRRFSSEEEKVDHILKVNLLHRSRGPISWARGVSRLLELRGVRRGQGSAAEKRWSQSATVADIAAELAVPERTLRYRLWLAEELADFPDLAEKLDAGEVTARSALSSAGKLNGVSKPDLGDGLSHPARYSDALLPVFADMLEGARNVLDPFAGTGRIHELEAKWGLQTVGVEIEPEWAALHEGTIVGNALELDFDDSSFDAICTSPTYGNRNADHHEAHDASTRRSYRHDLGRPLSKENSGKLQWGAAYRTFHEQAWEEAIRVLRPKGLFVLNIKDHIRSGRRQHVAGWHVTTLCRMGFTLLEHEEVETPAMRAGANSEQRFPEQVYLLRLDGDVK